MKKKPLIPIMPPSSQKKGESDDFPKASMPLADHLAELRRRLLLCVALFLASSAVFYHMAPRLMAILAYPLARASGAPRRFIYTGLTEAFITYIKVACFFGALITLPVMLIQVWRFIGPAFYDQEKKAIRPFFWASPLLFFTGLFFAYFFILPPAWAFFLAFQSTAETAGIHLALEARITEYVSLSMQIVLAFALSFQLPVILVLLGKWGVLKAEHMIKGRRFAILILLIVSAILTPPDVLSMIGLALPLYGLYELSLFIVKRMGPTKKQKNEND